ncbi:MAG: hypothetical protein AVDCRST_MAG56-4675 [uncultured Cytophagales bacterium]|uniref:Uncharacterized protein n=1 Tax=uncultured Cytophagales bacterium TaxID=158755 RepID=A0A6J4JZF5_9SPHI|nr:MAG: hypothetical protein AVDCRST_MAG56-4675 [uncultured Cytophagales bacterium]
MSTTPDSFTRLMLHLAQQHREMQESLRQSHLILAQSHQIGEDARRIQSEVAEAVAESQHNIAVALRTLKNK